jgi:hypothetical protein
MTPKSCPVNGTVTGILLMNFYYRNRKGARIPTILFVDGSKSRLDGVQVHLLNNKNKRRNVSSVILYH